MIRFGLLGAGRIGKIHGGNIAPSPKAQLVAHRRRRPGGGEGARRGDRRGGAHRRRDHRGQGHRRGPDRHADRHPCRPDRAVRAGQARRSSARSRSTSTRSASRPASRSSTRPAVPLMIGFNRRFDPNFAALKARLADGAIGDVEMVTIISRDPGAAADLLHRALGRPLPRHDDPRFRHGPLPARRGAGRGPRRRLGPGRSGDRQGRRRRHRDGDAARPPRASSARSPARAAPPTATTSASRCTARTACCAPATSTRPRSRSPTKGGFTADPVQNFFLERYAGAYRAELDAFIDAVKTAGTPSPSGQDGLKAQRLADAATEAHGDGQAGQGLRPGASGLRHSVARATGLAQFGHVRFAMSHGRRLIYMSTGT